MGDMMSETTGRPRTSAESTAATGAARRVQRIVALSAGLSSPSSTRMLVDQLAGAARAAIDANPGVHAEVMVYELRDYGRDITDMMLSRFPSERLSELIEAVRAADAVIAVTPIFNTGPSGLFKSFIDVVPLDVWPGKPVLLGATAGSARHSLALEYAIRPMFVYLKAALVPTAVVAASADFGVPDADGADEMPLAVRARRAAEELAVLGCGERRIGRYVEQPAESDGPVDEYPDAAAEGAPAEDAADAATGGPVGLDAEFSDFVPMDSLLHRG